MYCRMELSGNAEWISLFKRDLLACKLSRKRLLTNKYWQMMEQHQRHYLKIQMIEMG